MEQTQCYKQLPDNGGRHSTEAAFALFTQQPGLDSKCSPQKILRIINSLLPRLIDSALLREWTAQSLKVDGTHLVLASGKLLLQKTITGQELDGAADLEDGVGLEEAEEQQRDEAEQRQDDGQTDEDRRRPERRRQDRREVVEPTDAPDGLGVGSGRRLRQASGSGIALRQDGAKAPESEVSGALGGLGVPDPLLLQEDDDVEDGRAEGEDSPDDGHRLGVAEVLGSQELDGRSLVG